MIMKEMEVLDITIDENNPMEEQESQEKGCDE